MLNPPCPVEYVIDYGWSQIGYGLEGKYESDQEMRNMELSMCSGRKGSSSVSEKFS